MSHQLLDTDQKALEINLDDRIYGTFAEIGAGQEVARHFFQVGAAAGTIAKTMSAYDKTVSDRIYGQESSARYVCESRVYKMLDHEYDLMRDRLTAERPDTKFFVFADTVAAINYQKTIKGNGWLGLRFMLSPDKEPNDMVLHVRMHDYTNQLQQQAIGILGVNMVYGAYHNYQDPEQLLISLMDSLQGRISIDMVRLTGPDFADLDNRLLSLYLVKHQLTDVTIFNQDGISVHASEFLYKKHVLVVRAGFRPTTLFHLDMVRSSNQQFRNDPRVDNTKAFLLTEMRYDYSEKEELIDEKDFLDRAKILCMLGHTVILSNCPNQANFFEYLADYKVQRMALGLECNALLNLINDKYYENEHGPLLASFGELFTGNVKIYGYPSMQEGSEELMCTANLPIPEGITFIYQHLLKNEQIVDNAHFNPDVLPISSKQVLEMIRNDEDGWEKLVDDRVARLIKEQRLLGYPAEKMEFEY